MKFEKSSSENFLEKFQKNLGVILARSLHSVVSRNNMDETPIYAGAIATLVYEHIKGERGFDDNMGSLVRESKLLDFTLLSRMEMSEHGDHYMYSYKSSNGQSVSIRLPRVDLFDRATEKWTVEEVQPQEEPQNPGMQGYHYGYFPGDGSGGSKVSRKVF